jgi:hypothetical protein
MCAEKGRQERLERPLKRLIRLSDRCQNVISFSFHYWASLKSQINQNSGVWGSFRSIHLENSRFHLFPCHHTCDRDSCVWLNKMLSQEYFVIKGTSQQSGFEFTKKNDFSLSTNLTLGCLPIIPLKYYLNPNSCHECCPISFGESDIHLITGHSIQSSRSKLLQNDRTAEEFYTWIIVPAKVCKIALIRWWTTGAAGQRGRVPTVLREVISLGRSSPS